MSFRSYLPVLLGAMLAASCSDPSARLAGPRSLRADADVTANHAPASQHIFMMDGTIPADFATQVAARGGSIVRAHGEIGVVVARGLSDADALALAGGSGDVVRDTVVQWVPSPAAARVSMMTLPNAPPARAMSLNPPQAAAFLAFQWNMFQIHAPEAWNTRTGNPGVRVAILDTGLDPDHLDQFGLIDMSTSTAFVPSVTGPPTWADDNTHGTFVGGLVTSNNFGIAGVAPNVTLVAVKVLGATGSGSFGDIIAGIVYAANAHVQVINMSLGAVIPKNAPGVSKLTSALNRAINYAHRNDVLVVAAADNDDLDLQHDGTLIEVPCETGVDMCVSATGVTDTKASYSNFGTNAIAVAAPGGDVDGPPPTNFVLSLCSSHTADPALVVCKDGLHYLFAVGTSAAAPHVSGLGAFLDSQFGGQLNASQMINLIEQNADDIGKPGADPFYGKGRINVVRTVNTTHP